MAQDSDTRLKTIAHGKAGWGKLSPRAKIIPLTVASILAAATAIVCQTHARGFESLLSWEFSLAYGAALWLWWALVVDLLWRAETRWPAVLRLSPLTLVVHTLVGVGVVALHLGFLDGVNHLIVRFGPDTVKQEYRGLIFFSPPRFGMELLIYGLVWLACAAVKTELAAQR